MRVNAFLMVRYRGGVAQNNSITSAVQVRNFLWETVRAIARSESRQVLNGEQRIEPVYLQEALAKTSPRPKGSGGKQTGFGMVRLGKPGNIWNVSDLEALPRRGERPAKKPCRYSPNFSIGDRWPVKRRVS